MCHYLGGGLHGRQKRVKAQSESSKSVVNSVLISREKPVFPGFLEIIRVVDVKIEYVELSQDEFNARMSAYAEKLQEYFAEGDKLKTEIMEQLKKVKYE